MYERQMAEVYNWCCRAKVIHNVSVNIISFSNFSNSLLHFRHKIGEATISLLTGNPNTDDSLPATICPLETFPSNKLNFSQPEIKTSPLQTRQKFLVSTEEVRRAFNGVFFQPYSLENGNVQWCASLRHVTAWWAKPVWNYSCMKLRLSAREAS